LVESFAAREGVETVCRFGLTAFDNMVKAIHVIDIARADVQDFHKPHLFP